MSVLIQQIKDRKTQNVIYPITKTTAVYDDNNQRLEDRLEELEEGYSKEEIDDLLDEKQDSLTPSTGINLTNASVISIKNDAQTILTDDSGNLKTAVGGYKTSGELTTLVNGTFTLSDYGLQTSLITYSPFSAAPASVTCKIIGSYTVDSSTVTLNNNFVFTVFSEVGDGAYCTYLDDAETVQLRLIGPDYYQTEVQNKATIKGDNMDVTAATLTVTYQATDTYHQLDGRYLPIDNTTIVLDSNNKLKTNAYIKPDTGIPSSDMSSAVQVSLAKADSSILKSAQTTKTSSMTQNVGIDSDGKLWAEGSSSVPSEVANAITNNGMGWNVSANITWDGDTTGKEPQVISDDETSYGTFYKVSDLLPEVSDETLDIYYVDTEDGPRTYTATAYHEENSTSLIDPDDSYLFGFVARSDVIKLNVNGNSVKNITLPSPGIYFRKGVGDTYQVYIGAVNFGTAESKISKKYVDGFFVGKDLAGEYDLRVGVDSDGYVYFYRQRVT